MRHWLGVTFLVAFCADAVLSAAASLQPALQDWSGHFTTLLMLFTALVFFLALFGALEPAILFILPSLLFTLLLLSAVALWLFAGTSVGPGQDRLEYLETALPWFGAYNWCAQLVQFLTGAVCLVAYVRFIDREPGRTQAAP